MNELKPCPFCGGEAHLDRHDIFCDCGVKIEIPLFVSGMTSVGGFPTYEEAIQMMVEAWNDRADDNLINRQKAEIERLKRYDEERDIRLHARLTETARVEAIKEFAERLREKLYTIPSIYNSHFSRMVDNLVKEMTEE